MRFVSPFSVITLRQQMVSILRSQVQIAFSYVERAKREGRVCPDDHDLASARRVFDGAVSLRRRVELDVDDETDDIDRDLNRLATALGDASRADVFRAG
jgi:hypothetical protein